MNIVITNQNMKNLKDDHVVAPLAFGYNLFYVPQENPSGYIKVFLDAYSVDGSANKDAEFNISPARYKIWSDHNYNPLILLFALLHVQDHDYDQFKDIVNYHTHDGYTSSLIELIIENCCACGVPEMVLKTFAEILESFLSHPKGRNLDIDIYRDGGILGLSYVLDAKGNFINHGGSIGGSWLEPRGILLALAIELEMQTWEDENDTNS